MRRFVLPTAVLALAVVPALLACLHPPRDYNGNLTATTQEAIIFYREGHEDLVLKVNYKLQGDANNMPSGLAWVVPVPNKPDAYAVTKAGAFADAFRLAEQYRKPEKFNADSRFDAPKKSLEIEKVSVGEYDIHVLKATGPEAAAELNDWLVAAGFHAYPLEGMRYYTERKWTFLAVKVNKDRAAKSLAETGDLRPLRISFASEKVCLPLKLFASGGEIGVQASIFTEKPITFGNEAKGMHITTFAGQDYRSVRLKDQTLGKNLDALVAEVGKGNVGTFKSLYFTRIEGRVNGDKNKLVDWKTDVEFEFAKP